MWVDFPSMEHLDIWDWFGCSVRSVNEWDLNLTWCWCQVLDLARRSWELVFAPTMPPTRLLWKLWCRRPAYRWGWVEVVLENAFFLTQLLLQGKHIMICIGFLETIYYQSWMQIMGLSKLYVFLFPMRESSVRSWTWCKLRQKEKPSHCFQGMGIHIMPLVQASCSEHVNMWIGHRYLRHTL